VLYGKIKTNSENKNRKTARLLNAEVVVHVVIVSSSPARLIIKQLSLKILTKTLTERKPNIKHAGIRKSYRNHFTLPNHNLG